MKFVPDGQIDYSLALVWKGNNLFHISFKHVRINNKTALVQTLFVQIVQIVSGFT